MALPSFVTTNTFVEATSGNLTPAWHASPVADDCAFGIFICSSTTPATWPSPWTKVGQVIGTSFSASWAWARLTGSESGTFTITHSGSVMKAAQFAVYRGCIASGDPYEPASGSLTTNTGTGDTVTGVAVDTAGADRLVLFLAGYDNDIAGAQPSGGWTDRINQLVTASTDGHMQLSEIALASAGTQSAPTSVHTAGASEWASFGFALVPATAGNGLTLRRMQMAFLSQCAGPFGPKFF
jgi:hypothetical protein